MTTAIQVTATVLCVITGLMMLYVLVSLTKSKDEDREGVDGAGLLSFVACLGQILAIAAIWM